MPIAKKPAAKPARKLSAKSVTKQTVAKLASHKVTGAAKKVKQTSLARPTGVKASERAAIQRFVGVVAKAFADFLTESLTSQISKTASTRPTVKESPVGPIAKKAMAKPAATKGIVKPAARKAAAKKAAPIKAYKAERAATARAGGETTSTGPGKKA